MLRGIDPARRTTVSLIRRRNPLLVAIGGVVLVAVGIAGGRLPIAALGAVVITVAAVRLLTGRGA
jgi:hypothetical protein